MAFRIGRSEPSDDIPLWIRYRDLSRNVDQALARADRRAFHYYARARCSVLAALDYLLEMHIERELIAASAVREDPEETK